MTGDRIKDWELWERVKKTTQPLHNDHREEFFHAGTAERRPTEPKKLPSDPKRVFRPAPKGNSRSVTLPERPKVLEESVRRKIARGGLVIEGRLDLHGMTRFEAHDALLRFVEHAWSLQRRTVLIITGKGTNGEGILRNTVPRWLDEPVLKSMIIGYHEAAIVHGGSGALYVRIRRREGLKG